MANKNITQLVAQTGTADPSSLFYTVTGGNTDKSLPLSVLFNSPSFTGNAVIPFTQNGTGATARTVNVKLQEFFSVEDFGATGDGITDDTIAIQTAILAGEFSNKVVRFSAKRYKCTATLLIGSTGPIRLEGSTSIVFTTSFTQGTTLDFSSAPSNIIALDCGVTSGSTRREGIQIHNLNLYAGSGLPTVGAGSIGLRLKGCLQTLIENVTALGFDVGHYETETPSGGGVCSAIIMRMCRFDNNGQAAQRMDACIESRFERVKHGIAVYGVWIQVGPSGGQPNGNQWLGGTIIAANTNLFTNCIRAETGSYNAFDDVALEQSSAEAVYVAGTPSTSLSSNTSLILNNVEMDQAGGLNCNGANVAITNSRLRSVRSGFPVLNFSGGTSGTNQTRSRITGCYIGYGANTAAGLVLGTYNGLIISGCTIFDEASSGIAFANFGNTSDGCVLVNNIINGTHTTGWTATSLRSNIFENLNGNGTTYTRIIAGGASNIGTAATVLGPFSYNLAVVANWQRSGVSANDASIMLQRISSTGGASAIFAGANGTADGTYGLVPSNCDLFTLRAFGANGTSAQEAAAIYFSADGATASGDVPGRIRFRTRPSGGVLTERLNLDQNGNLYPLNGNYSLGLSTNRWGTINAQAATFTSTITPSTTAGIVGTTLADNANAGSIGEYLTNTATGVALTSGTAANVVTLSLTAGDWDVSGIVTFVNPGTTTYTGFIVGISTTSATQPTSNTGALVNFQLPFTTGVNQALATPSNVRINVSTTTTVYLVATAGFGTSTLTANGFISARRRR